MFYLHKKLLIRCRFVTRCGHGMFEVCNNYRNVGNMHAIFEILNFYKDFAKPNQ